jgi:hypothetical protein
MRDPKHPVMILSMRQPWLVCMFIVVSEDILVLAIGVGLNSVIQVMLVDGIEIEQEQE